jgi:uncharacterized membrane protein YdjX (TVP38/TMEM64 family)
MATAALPALPAWWISFVTWTSHLGIRGLVVFLTVYVLATLCFIPSWILKVGAGFAFGLVRGIILSAGGSALAAAAAFLLTRRWLREAARRHLAGTSLFQKVDRAIARRGARIAFLLRLCPVLPASLLNYLFGLTDIEFGPYLAASVLGMLPGVVFYAYFGSISRAEVAEALHHGWGIARLGLWLAGILVVFAVIAEVAKPWRRQASMPALDSAGEPDEPA